MNRKGWIKIVEAFVAILIIVGAALFIYGNRNPQNKDLSSEIYPIQRAILDEIQNNEEFRTEIVGINESNLPILWENFSSSGLGKIQNKIVEKTPANLECVAKICKLGNVICDIEYLNKEIYAQPVVISTNVTEYSPKQLKLFCYLK
jgi:methionine synthase II (cobalamin-independent)